MSEAIVDLRSDTVTLPSEGMRRAMAAAELGDDVYGEDPSVNRLEELLAGEAGFEAGLFMPSGTQSNLVALMSHCQRGDEYIVGQEAHTYKYEGGGAAVLGSIQPQPLENDSDGSIPIEKIRAAIKPDDIHFPRTRLIALENTISGRVLSHAYLGAVATLAKSAGLPLHLDGARVFNAAAANGVTLEEECRYFDSVSICLSKGLGTPAGSVLVGRGAFIKSARRWRKMLGGGLRQAGVLAAAGLYALENNVKRIGDDHRRAQRLADGLRAFPNLRVSGPNTNILFVDIPEADVAGLSAHLAARGVRVTLRGHTRLVSHLNVDDAGIERALSAFGSYYG
jgi:threonine aldolase